MAIITLITLVFGFFYLFLATIFSAQNMVILEKDLFEKIKEGDSKAFDLLFQNNYSKLCTLSVTIVKRPEIAEEIVQDVFIKFWKSRTSLIINSSLTAYLFKMVQNFSLNYIRNHSTKKTIVEQSLEDTDIQIDTHNGGISEPIIEKLQTEEIEHDFKNALDLLPTQCRQIFSLCRFEGLSYSEIAIKLDVSVSTIKTQMGRAMDKLHEQMRKHLA